MAKAGMSDDGTSPNDAEDCVIHSHPVPPDQLTRYSPDRDPHSEQDIAAYVEGQAPDESVQHVERVKQEVVLGDHYVVWDATTDKNRWWVITNPTNLYSQQHFPSLDYTLSFHIGLMMRVRSRSGGPDIDDPTPFDDVLRRLDQARARQGLATEVEELQAVGMQLRECLISLVSALRRRLEIEPAAGQPKDADVVHWLEVLFDELCSGPSNKELRGYLRATSKSTWQLVNWLTHHRDAKRSAVLVALEACNALVSHSVLLLMRSRTDMTDECPRCNSRDMRSHFDIAIEPDGDYYTTCASCGWTTYPMASDAS